jgi:hypothetical protein
VAENSLYYPAHEWLNEVLSLRPFLNGATPSDVWAKQVVAGLSRKNPPDTISVGAFTWTVWIASWLPSRIAQKLLRDVVKIDLVVEQIQGYGREKAIANTYGEK